MSVSQEQGQAEALQLFVPPYLPPPLRARLLRQNVVLSSACRVKMANYSSQHKLLHIQTRQV